MGLGCGACGSGRARPFLPAEVRGGAGFYMLALYPTCTERYSGELNGGAVHVVAPGTPNEKLFKWGTYDEAVAYATSVNSVQIDNVLLTNLCRQAVEELYAA